jgi:hypothetical protein
LNVSNHTDGRTKKSGTRLRDYGRRNGRLIAATVRVSLLTRGKLPHRKNMVSASLHLILRSRAAASRRMNGTIGAAWFETALRGSSP